MFEARKARSKAARRELAEVVFHTMRQQLGETRRGAPVDDLLCFCPFRPRQALGSLMRARLLISTPLS